MPIDRRARQQDTQKTGQLGADEPDYGRPAGHRPDPQPKSGPNRQGPQYEQGGAYPGKRQSLDRESTLPASMHVPINPNPSPQQPGDPTQPIIPPEIPPREDPPSVPPNQSPTYPPTDDPIDPPLDPEREGREVELPPASGPATQQV
jgi:hypothetical protein